MPFLADSVRDGGLQVITDATGKELHICSSEPADRAAALAASLGQKVNPSVSAPTDGDVNGRKVTISAVADGVVDADGTASHYALISGTELLATQALASSQVVTNGNPWTSPAIDITKPDVP